MIGGCLFGYSFLGERKRPVRGKQPKPNGTVVTTESLVPHSGTVSLSANGVVVPLREIRLATEVAGRVVEQSDNLRPGRSVVAGETLIQLDTTEFELELRRLRAQQAQEAAELAATDISIQNTTELLSLASEQLQLAADERARVDALVKRQAASVSEVDVTKRAELTARAALVETGNRKRDLLAGRELIVQKQVATRVAIDRAQLDLDRTTVKSPINGRVVSSSVEEQSFVAAGTSFVTIEDTSVVEVRSNLTVDQMYRVWNSNSAHAVGSEAELTADDQVPPVPATIQYRLGARTYQWQAVLERIDGAGIDPATRTYPCLFRVDAPEQVSRPDRAEQDDLSDGPSRLMRGMFVSVLLKTESRRQLASCSETAIRPGNRIWINRDGALHIQPIEVVARQGTRVIIDLDELASQAAQTSVVVSPVSNPSEGMKLISAGKSEREGKPVLTGEPGLPAGKPSAAEQSAREQSVGEKAVR
ncbi:multidrug resistance protein MdtN [Rubripirellula reticaptiva]|uniref:Multidrug resistance protein MdtN n=1 Tax=Rubripirellula reticaptiva TaxID=2528013 RepID=A0A5C6EP19_9BACT|nr:multidrug resistance protein MdtN [Rubripirellula reticaptiva]